MSRPLVLLLAVAGGAAVGNLYWAQPLLDFIARDLRTSTAAAGWLVTATQLGYALGVLLLVPLGDVLDRRRLVPAALVAVAVALVAAALAPTFPVLLAALALVGITTVAGQIIAPLAGDLAGDGERGRVVGTVVSGILVGILLSRTISGLVAAALGWRAVYAAAAVLAVVLALLLRRAIPDLAPRTRLAYPALLGSVFGIVRERPTVRFSLVLGGTSFGVFTMFWTALTFLLSAPPFSFGVATIGLFGLVGLAGAITAQRAGRLSDRGLGLPAIGVAWVLVLVAFVVAGIGSRSVVGVVVAVLVLDVAIQGHNISVQSRLFQLDPAARSRINTAFVANNFVFGAIGSGLASVLWALGGWTAVTLAGAVLSGFAATVWLVGRRAALRLPSDRGAAGATRTPRAEPQG
ncbi:MFS transporter [Amnibacterium endophyticum]|uniref:MFS transporter n=1 Tax=Amnibacterium endophyticum TaxID=2109337 RepID=A0ABW4LAU3_9MICO